MTSSTCRSDNSGNNYWEDVKDVARRFGSLPPQLLVVLTLEFLNSFRSFGLRFILYIFVTNEFHLSDEEAGLLLGAKGLIDVFFGLCGSILVDLVGVRRTSVAALSVAVVARSLLAFGRSRASLLASALFLSPIGEALLGTGLYRVALKKLTTPRTRPVAFAVAYAASNLAGAAADLVIDRMRRRPDAVVCGAVFTPARMFVVVTLGAVVAALAVAVLFLRDVTVADADDPEDDVAPPPDAADARPMMPFLEPRVGYKVFDTASGSAAEEEEEGEGIAGGRREGAARTSPSAWAVAAARRTARQIAELLRCRNMWRILVFGFAALPLSIQWSASEMVMPPFLERSYGETAPAFAVQSINLWGCLALPPVVGVLTAPLENFRVILPGMWLMALSLLAMLRWPTVAGACLWQVFLTLGEVFWSPRVLSWTAMLAPTGREGLFFAMASSRAVLMPLGDYLLGRLNSEYNPNCPDCRDRYGHFCSDSEGIDGDATDGLFRCISEEEACDALPFTEDPNTCPSTCQDCPGWEPNAQVLWSLLLLISLISPVLVWLLLPFFRGRHRFGQGFYGVSYCGLGRILGICGIDEVNSINLARPYERVDAKAHVLENSRSDVDDNARDGELELT